LAETNLAAAPKVGTNIDRPVIDLYRPHITSVNGGAILGHGSGVVVVSRAA